MGSSAKWVLLELWHILMPKRLNFYFECRRFSCNRVFQNCSFVTFTSIQDLSIFSISVFTSQTPIELGQHAFYPDTWVPLRYVL